MRNVILKSGQEMPLLGLGTWQLTGNKCTEAVKNALEFGYRHIDTADAYNNHREIAAALAEGIVDRDKLFITSKARRDLLSYNDVLSSGDRILDELGIEYLDLLLIHWPNKRIPLKETLEALTELKEQRKTRNIGVSNFTLNHLKDALEFYPDLISINQVEFHPYLYQKELLEFCRAHDIVITAYSPLARGKVFKDSQIKALAEKYDQSPARLVLRWLVEKEIVVIPKASSVEHLRDNLDIFDWEMPARVVEVLDGLNEDYRIIAPPFNEFDYKG